MKKIKTGVEAFFLNLAGMSIIHARAYLKMPRGDAFQAFLWDCLLESFMFAVLFTLIVSRLPKRTPKDEGPKSGSMN